MGQRVVSPILRRTTITTTTSCRTEFFDMASAQRARQVPADSHENDLGWKMRLFETHRHRFTPSCRTRCIEGDHNRNDLK
jgi:hypothetical protein